MVSYRKWTVVVVREIDGIRIVKRLAGLTAGEVFTLNYEEQMYPGDLLLFEKTPYEYGDVDEDAMSSDDGDDAVFALLRESYDNNLSQTRGPHGQDRERRSSV